MGLRHKALRKRFFVLTKDRITYSKGFNSTKPQGTIFVSDIKSVETAVTEETANNKYVVSKENVFKIVTESRIYICVAETSVEMNAWIDAIIKVLRPSSSD